MLLNIDTTNPDYNVIKLLEKEGSLIAKSKAEIISKKHSLLEQIKQLFNQNQMPLSAIKQIQVNPGPGTSFSRTRLGVTIANALVFALNIKVNGKEFETPIYHKEPNITLPCQKPPMTIGG